MDLGKLDLGKLDLAKWFGGTWASLGEFGKVWASCGIWESCGRWQKFWNLGNLWSLGNLWNLAKVVELDKSCGTYCKLGKVNIGGSENCEIKVKIGKSGNWEK